MCIRASVHTYVMTACTEAWSHHTRAAVIALTCVRVRTMLFYAIDNAVFVCERPIRSATDEYHPFVFAFELVKIFPKQILQLQENCIPLFLFSFLSYSYI